MMAPRARVGARGYSLIEIMAAVAIVGILAALAVMGYRKWLVSARTGETKDLVMTIVQGQHMYYTDSGGYLDCSTAWNDWYPMAPNDRKHLFHDPGHTEYNCWKMLAPNSTDPMMVSFVTRAGTKDDIPMQPPTAFSFNFPTPQGPWFMVLAAADTDVDNQYAYWFTSSFTPNDVHAENEDE